MSSVVYFDIMELLDSYLVASGNAYVYLVYPTPRLL
jgi:hypothetical protein